ncbi:hypothetical protein VIGAN_UM034500 [Vigna angularis var. angularis]|uniref:Glucose-6-phosphate 1-epimerase n=1 Tax=Vigna angularis var. angularis TaxID=157739 RepID=A0A0S3TDJ8_PHAAN|nr:hypothetical protein VIGAN_UM034500 [Vigna angularis var. angularis]
MGHSAAVWDYRAATEITKDWNGIDQVLLRTPRGSSARVSLHGAQVTSWRNEHGEELLFTSSKFGNCGSLEQHGFARNRMWAIDENPPPLPGNDSSGKSFIDLVLKSSEEDMKCWPHSEIRIEGLETLDYLDNLFKKERFTEQGDAITFESEKSKSMVDFGDEEYKQMLCVDGAVIEKPVSLKPGEEWTGRLQLSVVPSSFCSDRLGLDRSGL